MSKEIIPALVETLVDRVNALDMDDAFQSRPDDMAWAAIALHELDADTGLTTHLKQTLAQRQQPDGSVPLLSTTPAAGWPTALALLAWRLDPAFAEQRKRAVAYLTSHRGSVLEEQLDYIGHDVTLHGWPWIQGTHSWVEPTAHAIMALTSEGLTDDPTVREAVTMMQNRMLANGAWNYGNTEVYGTSLLPMPECTGVALCALRHEQPETAAEKSMAYLEEEYPRLRTPLSLSWTIMGLSAWGRRPHDSEEQVARCLSLQERYGPYETALIALLATSFSDFPLGIKDGA